MQPVILRDHAVFTGLQLMPATSNDPLQIGEWLVDPRDDSLTRGAEKMKVEPRTMRLLMRLAQTPGAVVSQDELLESVWSGVVVGTASVYQSMSQLRKVLGDTEDPPRYIETVARKGYRLVARVSTHRALLSTNAVAPGQSGAALVPVERRAIPALPVLLPKPAAHRWRWVALATAAAVAALFAVWQFAFRGPTLQAASIVVLPFVDLTSGGTEQIFCDGLTEELSNWLAQIPTLRVVARTSAFAFRNRTADVRSIGRELATSHVLEGSLRRSGDKMRITVRLIDTVTGYPVWSGEYDVEAGDVLEVQEKVARSVASNLELRMTADVDGRFAGRHSSNAVAQRLYLLAKGHGSRLDASSNEEAITLYRQALDADPSFALAKVWLAQAIGNRRYFNTTPIEELSPQIEPLLADVEKSAPQLVDLYIVRGGYRIELRQREAALRDLQHALEMNPNSKGAASTLGFYYLTAGQPRDAFTYYTMASAVDPRDYGMHAYRCMALTDLAQFVAASAACDRARALEPESPWVSGVTSQMEAARGRFEDALKWSDEALTRGNDIAELHADRAFILLNLGMLTDVGIAYRRAAAGNADSVHQNPMLTIAGAASAIDGGGAASLAAFIRDNELEKSEVPSVLFALANVSLIVGNDKQARVYVDRALESKLLQPEDVASPWDARIGQSSLLVTATALRATGDAAGAERRLDELEAVLTHLVDSGVQTPGLYELRAQLAAMRGKADEAMTELNHAAQLGWTAAWMAEHQPYFNSLRARADFRALLAAVGAKNAATAAKLRPRLSIVSGLLRRPAGSAAASE